MHYFGVFIVTFNMPMPTWVIIEISVSPLKAVIHRHFGKNVLNLLKKHCQEYVQNQKLKLWWYILDFFSVFIF